MTKPSVVPPESVDVHDPDSLQRWARALLAAQGKTKLDDETRAEIARVAATALVS